MVGSQPCWPCSRSLTTSSRCWKSLDQKASTMTIGATSVSIFPVARHCWSFRQGSSMIVSRHWIVAHSKIDIDMQWSMRPLLWLLQAFDYFEKHKDKIPESVCKLSEQMKWKPFSMRVLSCFVCVWLTFAWNQERPPKMTAADWRKVLDEEQSSEKSQKGVCWFWICDSTSKGAAFLDIYIVSDILIRYPDVAHSAIGKSG